jgi:hypothetical protein
MWGEPALIGEHYNETGLLALADGSVVAALRSETGGHLAIAFSKTADTRGARRPKRYEIKNTPAICSPLRAISICGSREAST